MTLTPKQAAAVADLYNALVESLSVTPGLGKHIERLQNLKLRLGQIELHLFIEAAVPGPSTAQSDTDFLRSLRIAPELIPDNRR